MPLETATYVSDLVLNNPAGSDPLAKSADHIRLIKAVLKNTLGNTSGVLSVPTDGTSSAPAYAFASEPALGLYRAGAGKVGIAGSLIGQGSMPIGSFIDYGGTVAPAGYLACNGQAVSRTTYADLYLAIGTIWGAGDGSTTFNVPNMIDRYRRHAGGGHGGPVGTLQDPDLLPHTHAVVGGTGYESTAHSHSFSGTTGSMNQNTAHSHTMTAIEPGNPNGATGLGNTTTQILANNAVGTTSTVNIDHLHSFSGTTGGESANHSHAIAFTSGSAGTSETRPYTACVLTCIRAL